MMAVLMHILIMIHPIMNVALQIRNIKSAKTDYGYHNAVKCTYFLPGFHCGLFVYKSIHSCFECAMRLITQFGEKALECKPNINHLKTTEQRKKT